MRLCNDRRQWLPECLFDSDSAVPPLPTPDDFIIGRPGAPYMLANDYGVLWLQDGCEVPFMWMHDLGRRVLNILPTGYELDIPIEPVDDAELVIALVFNPDCVANTIDAAVESILNGQFADIRINPDDPVILNVSAWSRQTVKMQFRGGRFFAVIDQAPDATVEQRANPTA